MLGHTKQNHQRFIAPSLQLIHLFTHPYTSVNWGYFTPTNPWNFHRNNLRFFFMGAHLTGCWTKNSLENIPPKITMHLLLGWSLPKKMGRFFKKWPLFRVITLPETNIAMENPSFWWYLPGKMWIFMGYVSFKEGTPLLPRCRITLLQCSGPWPVRSKALDAMVYSKLARPSRKPRFKTLKKTRYALLFKRNMCRKTQQIWISSMETKTKELVSSKHVFWQC